MSDEEQIVAEQVVPTSGDSALTVRISQHMAEEFWRVDITSAGRRVGHMSTTVAPGDNFMIHLIHGAVSGEEVAWRHLAHWGEDNLGRAGHSGRLLANRGWRRAPAGRVESAPDEPPDR